MPLRDRERACENGRVLVSRVCPSKCADIQSRCCCCCCGCEKERAEEEEKAKKKGGKEGNGRKGTAYFLRRCFSLSLSLSHAVGSIGCGSLNSYLSLGIYLRLLPLRLSLCLPACSQFERESIGPRQGLLSALSDKPCGQSSFVLIAMPTQLAQTPPLLQLPLCACMHSFAPPSIYASIHM